MTKDYYKKKAEKLLENIEVYRLAVETMKDMEACGGISLRKAQAAREKRIYYEKLLAAADRALALLTPTERQVIEEIYLNQHEHTFFDICDACAMEKSSVYRYRAKALDKIGRAVFGI